MEELKLIKKLVMLVLPILLISCAVMDYTKHADVSLRGTKIEDSKTFIVFPLDNPNFQPPTSCGSPTSKHTKDTVEDFWNDKIAMFLKENFPNQQFNFMKDDSQLYREEKSTFFALKAEAFESSYVKIINLYNGEENPIEYIQSEPNKVIKEKLKPYLTKYPADYAVIFVEPSLSGSIHTSTTTSYNVSSGGMSTSSSSQTIYTANVEIQVWDCNSGILLFNSGAYVKNSDGGCMLVTPEEVSMKNNSKKLTERLAEVVSGAVNVNNY